MQRRTFLSLVRIARSLAIVGLFSVLAACTTATQVLQVTPPPPLTSEKYAAIVVDGNSGRTLYQSNATASRYPASLTKMMTLYMLFEAMDSGRISASTPIPVSAHAASQAPSKLGLKRGSSIRVDTAIDALAVKSANDVAAAVGEFLGGSEDRFAAMMTAKARQLGMSSTVFRNASGLPDAGQHTTARDMALLGMALKRRFPHHFDRFSQRSFAYNGRTVSGHNRLIGRVEGVDGIKTGYIRASGYNVVTSVGRRGKRLVVVVMGGKSGRERDQHVEELIERYLPAAGRGAAPVAVAARPAPPPVEQPAAVPAMDEELPGVASPATPSGLPPDPGAPSPPADVGAAGWSDEMGDVAVQAAE